MLGGIDTFKNSLVLFVALLLLSGGCSASEVKLDASHNASQKDVDRGQTLVVTLESNPSTGYSWQVSEADSRVLRQSGAPVFQAPGPQSPPIVGAAGTETFRFEAVGAGTANLKLAYRRPWEKDAPPIKTFTVQVTVR